MFTDRILSPHTFHQEMLCFVCARTGCCNIFYFVITYRCCYGLIHYFRGCYLGLFGIMWYILWLFVVHVSPNTHPTISKRERNYINRNIITRKVLH